MPAILQLKRQLKSVALELGFDLCGIAGVADTPEHRFFPGWIDDGRAGEMKYLKARNDSDELKRASLANAVPWARSVVLCAVNYNADAPYSTHAGSPSRDGSLVTPGPNATTTMWYSKNCARWKPG